MNLEDITVGGEQVKNKEMMAKRNKKKEHAEYRSEKIRSNLKAYLNSRPDKRCFRQVQLTTNDPYSIFVVCAVKRITALPIH